MTIWLLTWTANGCSLQLWAITRWKLLIWRSSAVTHSIGGLHEPQGVAFLKDKMLLAVANGDGGTCDLFDAKSYKPIKTIDFQDDADNVRYDFVAKRMYVGFGNGALGVVDVETQKRLADIKLPSHPESFQLEANGNRIYVNLPKSRQIAVVDRNKGAVVDSWSLRKAQANFPMALDEAESTAICWMPRACYGTRL